MMPNNILEKYKEITQMSSNNYSTIYEAKDKSNNIDVIIKEIDLNKYSRKKELNITIIYINIYIINIISK